MLKNISLSLSLNYHTCTHGRCHRVLLEKHISATPAGDPPACVMNKIKFNYMFNLNLNLNFKQIFCQPVCSIKSNWKLGKLSQYYPGNVDSKGFQGHIAKY